jgi:hypothetical protein
MSVANGLTVWTGHGGKVMYSSDDGSNYYLLSRITQWSATLTVTEATWADSDSNGYTNRKAGRRDLTGSITGKLDTTYPIYNYLLSSINFTDVSNLHILGLILWQDANEDVGVASSYWDIPRALLNNLAMSFDRDSQEPVEWSADFGTDGTFTYPGESGQTSRTLTASFAS